MIINLESISEISEEIEQNKEKQIIKTTEEHRAFSGMGE